MSSNGYDGSARTANFDIDSTYHGHDGPKVPTRADVNVTADANTTLVAIVEAGEHGRWSFDFRVDGGIEITNAYDEGMRIDVDELPTWMAPVHHEIEALVSGEQ